MSGHLARRALSAALALVAAVLVIPAAASATSASAATAAEALPVRVEITAIDPVVLRPGQDLVVHATLHNDGATTIEHPAAVLRVNAFRMTTRDEVGEWASRSPTELAGTKSPPGGDPSWIC